MNQTGGYLCSLYRVEDESKNIEYAVVNNQTIRHLFLICTIILLFLISLDYFSCDVPTCSDILHSNNFAYWLKT